MTVNELLKTAGYEVDKDYPGEIKFVTDDSRKVSEGCAFVCIKGARFDGHDAAEDCVRKGASLVVCQRDLGLDCQLIVDDTREAYSLLSAACFGNPAEKLRLIGLTGTNGKTTSAFLIKRILDFAGHKTGLIGTVRNMIGDEYFDASLTTPDPYEMHSLFAGMVKAGCEFCVMEVSSQALDQQRVAGLEFETAAFTNLTQDHLDYHHTFENYIDAKRKLFGQCSFAVLNGDDPAYTEMIKDGGCGFWTYTAKSAQADFTAKDIVLRPDGVDYVLEGEGVEQHVSLGIPGEFTVYNSMTAFLCAMRSGVPAQVCADALSSAAGVPGRIELVPTDTDYYVIIDYAHSPDGLKNILSSLRKAYSGRIIAVFGCGGDRDSTKRPIMGRIASEMADFIVVTSDNPRSEDPARIVEEVAAGTEGSSVPVVKIVDRTQAIAFAMNEADPGDVVLLAGKGHETYQILSTGKIHYDEREIVKNILSAQR